MMIFEESECTVVYSIYFQILYALEYNNIFLIPVVYCACIFTPEKSGISDVFGIS